MSKHLTILTVFCAIVMASLLTGDARSVGQDKETKSTKKADVDTAKETKTRKRPRGRLPAYFTDVVTGEQREAIYKIQAGYNAEIAELRLQVEELISDRNQEVEAVLSEEQLVAVNKKRAEAKARREARLRKSADN